MRSAEREGEDNSPEMFFLGVDPAKDHSSQTQFDDWKAIVNEVLAVYRNSPIAADTHGYISMTDFAQIGRAHV